MDADTQARGGFWQRLRGLRWPGMAAASPAPVPPPGQRIYAVGDIHGRADLLDRLHALIVEDAARAPQGTACRIVYLGDYVDRGPDSAGVIARLIAGPPPGWSAVHLRGNHDAALLAFLRDAAYLRIWGTFGGLQTLASYGVAPPSAGAGIDALEEARAALEARLPASHRAFLEATEAMHVVGGLVFVHAGLRPGLPLSDQVEDDLLWIREPFLSSPRSHGKLVVHGHSPSELVEILPNRVGVDTGAYATGVLSAVVFDGGPLRILDTRPR